MLAEDSRVDLNEPGNLVEVVDVSQESAVSKLSPYKGFILLVALLGLGFIVDAKVNFDRQADFKERQERMEKAIIELQRQSTGVSDVRQDVKNLDDKVQKMGDSLNKRLDDLMQADFNRRGKGLP